MENISYVAEGYYKDNNGKEYMSIWTFKRKNGITTGDNFEEAKAINCSDKFKAPFNATDRFREGWMYSVVCLVEFYGV